MLISEDLVGSLNDAARVAHEDEFGALGRKLQRRGVDIEALVIRAMAWSVAVPTWGVGTGGTRFARFPGKGEPRNIHDKLADCGVIQQLTRGTRTVSPHIPWDKVSDYNALRQEAAQYGLGFDAVNSNTFQDQADERLSYRFGSLANVRSDIRAQAVAHNIECIEIGKALGAPALTVWIGDGTNFAGQQSLGGMFEAYLSAMEQVYAALPPNMAMFIEHKMYEPAFYSTVISDWGSSLMAAQHLGPQAKCLVDLGHHAPNVNIEQIVARHRPDRKPDGVGGGDRARLCSGLSGGQKGSDAGAGGQRRDGRASHAESRVPDRCLADPGGSADAAGRGL